MTAYALCGLVLESELDFPELGACAARPDLHLRLRPIDARRPDSAPEGSWFVCEPGQVVLAWDGLPLIRLIEGREIHVQPRPFPAADSEPELRGCLLGPVLSLVLLQRGLYPLHASTALIDGRALAFAAPSGTGKSTLAAACLRRGHALLSDDVTAVDLAGPRPWAHSGRSTLRLSPESWTALGHDPDRLPRVESEDDKRGRAMGAAFHSTGAPLAGILILEDGPEERLERLEPRQGLLAVLGNCHRFDLAARTLGHEFLLNAAARVVERVAVQRLVRRKTFDRLEALVDLVEERGGQPMDRPER